MFSRNNKNKGTHPVPQKVAQPTTPSVPSLISADLKITGDLKSEGEIQVDGVIVGDIMTKTLLIGKTANIKGGIIADEVKVHGNVNGQIKARTVTLAKTAHVVGDILHEDLSIQTGAFLEGLCKRISSSELADSGGKINLVDGNLGESKALAAPDTTNRDKKAASVG